MKRILITSGATREYLDPVRYLTNGSSGQMGAALVEAVLQQGNVPVVVSGQVTASYPAEAEVHQIITTEDMRKCCVELFPDCIGVIGAAAPCDFRPADFSEHKIAKTKDGSGIILQLSETPDILAALGKIKRSDQWSVAFALETKEGTVRALDKLKQKNCNFVVLNHPEVINSMEGTFQAFDAAGALRLHFTGTKRIFAKRLLRLVQDSETQNHRSLEGALQFREVR